LRRVIWERDSNNKSVKRTMYSSAALHKEDTLERRMESRGENLTRKLSKNSTLTK
jgi:hypothetical protein